MEHAPEEIWQTTLLTCRQVMDEAIASAADIAEIALTNQPPTTFVCDKKSSTAIHPAIVWHQRRTPDKRRHLREDNYESLITEKTGLLLDPYFSST